MRKFMMTVVVAAAVCAVGFAQSPSGSQATGSTNGSVNNSNSANVDRNGAQVNSNSSGSAATSDAVTGKHGSSATSATQSASSDQSLSADRKGVSQNGTAAESGTMNAVLTKSVDSKKAKSGDEVQGKTTSDMTTAEGTKIPRNSKLVGHVTDAKSKGKGETQSQLGFVFDKAVLKDGREVPLHAVLQAVAAPVQAPVNMASDMDDMGPGPQPAAGGGSMGAPRGGNGGIVGGATNTVGSVGRSTTGTVENSTNAAGGVAGNAGRNAGAGANGALATNTTGVIGLKNIQLQQATAATSGLSTDVGAPGNGTEPVLTSTSSNIRLDSGTQMVLRSEKGTTSNGNASSPDKNVSDKPTPNTSHDQDRPH